MFLRDKLCRKKILLPCALFLSFLAVLLSPVSSYAQGVWIARFGARVNTWANGEPVCNVSSYADDYLYNDIFYGCQLTGIQVYSQSTLATGNSVVWNGKLNIVKRVNPLPDGSNYRDRFKGEQNFNFSHLKFGNVDLNVVNQQRNYWRTTWTANNYTYQTLTIAWTISATASLDIVNQSSVLTMSIFPNDGSSFDYTSSGYTSNPYYFENTNEAMEVLFTPNGLEGMNQLINENKKLQIQNQTIINQNDAMISNQNRQIDAINAQTEQQHEDYENEVEREENKEDELEDQSGDLGLSAQSPSDPWSNLFPTVGPDSCRNLTSFSSLFHLSTPIRLCSPYPSDNNFPQVISTFVTTALVYILIVRLYAKHLKGGVNG